MTLHPVFLHEMLADEVEGVRIRLGGRLKSIRLSGTNVIVEIGSSDWGDTIRFAGASYDAEPFQVAVITPSGDIAASGQWPKGLYHSDHPILGRGFICIRGTYEYHCHPSHVSDAWAAYRNSIRLPQLLDHILKKVKM